MIQSQRKNTKKWSGDCRIPMMMMMMVMMMMIAINRSPTKDWLFWRPVWSIIHKAKFMSYFSILRTSSLMSSWGIAEASSRASQGIWRCWPAPSRKNATYTDTFFFPKDVSSQGSSEDCWRISHHTYPTYLTPHISHTYPSHHTYPTHIHSKRIPPIRIPPIRIHAMRIHSKRLHQQVLQYVSHQHVSVQYNCIARVWTWNSLLAIGLPACLPVVCFCACFLIILYYSIPPGGMGRVNRKATLSLKTRRRSPKTVAKRKFHLLTGNPLGKNVVSIAQNCSETQISFSAGQPSR